MDHAIRLKLLIQVFLEFFKRRLAYRMDDIVAQNKKQRYLVDLFRRRSIDMSYKLPVFLESDRKVHV